MDSVFEYEKSSKVIPRYNTKYSRKSFSKHFLERFGILLLILLGSYLFIITINNMYKLTSHKRALPDDKKVISRVVKLESTLTRSSAGPLNDVYDPLIEVTTEILLEKLIIPCTDKKFEQLILVKNGVRLHLNYVQANHGRLHCDETITYTTHGDFRFLDNLVPLLERWQAPLSIALYTPGTDFEATIDSILYLRNCIPEAAIIVQLVSFHMFYENKHKPKKMGSFNIKMEILYECPDIPPYDVKNNEKKSYRAANNLTYPVNVARNIARNAALTHFVLASDIDFYPSLDLVDDFFKMLRVENDASLVNTNNVFVLPIFEVKEHAELPSNKSELLPMIKSKKAVWYHYNVCANCHVVPNSEEWLEDDGFELRIASTVKRTGDYSKWNPIYIGTNADPEYAESLGWEGKSDTNTQSYGLCLLNYNFNVLSNAFLVHKPGIKVFSNEQYQLELASREATNKIIREKILPELHSLYGTRKSCS